MSKIKIIKLTKNQDFEYKVLYIEYKNKKHLIIFDKRTEHKYILNKILKHLKEYKTIKPGLLIDNKEIIFYSDKIEELYIDNNELYNLDDNIK